jgi:hypothetical protein
MSASYVSNKKDLKNPTALCIRRVCRLCALCIAGIAFMATALGYCRTAHAQQRGAIGGALNAGFGVSDGNGEATVAVSAWYRLIPAVALGFNLGSTSLVGQSEQHGTELNGYSSAEAFLDARAFPSSPFGLFGRASLGVGRVTLLSPSTRPLYTQRRTELIGDLEAGPELRIFFASPATRARPDLFLRLGGTLTSMSDATYFGLGLALGFEG